MGAVRFDVGARAPRDCHSYDVPWARVLVFLVENPEAVVAGYCSKIPTHDGTMTVIDLPRTANYGLRLLTSGSANGEWN